MDVVSIATTSKSRQFHRRRKKASSLKKKQDIRRTPVESMNVSTKGGPKVRDEVVSMNPQKRHLQTTKGTGVAVHQGAHLTVDSHYQLMEPGPSTARGDQVWVMIFSLRGPIIPLWSVQGGGGPSTV